MDTTNEFFDSLLNEKNYLNWPVMADEDEYKNWIVEDLWNWMVNND